jgi:CDP-diacylglycerol--glycerol-3-phosphate 3-phosphatidyltransferase
MKELVKIGLIPDWLDDIFYKSVTPFIRFFSSTGINPNWLTFLGFLQNVVAACFIAYGQFLLACLFIVIAGIFDFIDGKVAARTHQVTTFGAIFDSTLDRYSDMVIYLGIAIYYHGAGFYLSALAAIVALIGSVMTSYIKAIGESHGFKFRVGVLRRQERITLISIGLFFTFWHTPIETFFINIAAQLHINIDSLPVMPLTLFIYFLAIFSNFTAVQRFIHLGKIATKKD